MAKPAKFANGHERSKPAWAGSDLNAVARGFNESHATETNRDSKTREPQSGANGHLPAPNGSETLTEDDGTTAERELLGKHSNATLRSHHDDTSKTPRQLLKSVAAELPSCSKATPQTSSDDHSLNVAGSDQGNATNGSTIREQDDFTGQFSRTTSTEAAAQSDFTQNAAYETADQRSARLDMLAWQQGRILPPAWRPQWSPDRAHEGIEWGLDSPPTLHNTGEQHQHQQRPPGGGQAQVQTTGYLQVHEVPQKKREDTGVGELYSSPTEEHFRAPAYISPLPTRAPSGVPIRP